MHTSSTEITATTLPYPGLEEALGSNSAMAALITSVCAAGADPVLWNEVLERAASLQQRLRTLEAEAAGLNAALDAAEQAVLCVNAAGKVTMVNAAASKMLDAADGLRLGPGDMLLCERAADTVALRKLVAERLSQPVQGVAAMKVGRRGEDAAPLNVTAMPLNGEKSLLLFLGDPDRAPRSRADVMRSLYGLTPAEGRVCDGLLQGLETREVAERMRTTLETARFHMKQILRKTGTGRQSELVRLMMALPTLS